MKTIELKNILIHRIGAINDRAFLNAIKTIIDTKTEKEVFTTTEEQKQKIEEGRKHIACGNVFSDDQVEKEIDRWLKEK